VVSINKAGIKFTKINDQYIDKYGSKASRELFVQFFIRINEELSGSILASFSKLKFINSSNFRKFRNHFKVHFKKGFMCPASTFDNVKGAFPIGFIIWLIDKSNYIESTYLDVYSKPDKFVGKKLIHIPEGFTGKISMNDWIKRYDINSTNKYLFGFLNCSSQDFLHQNYTGITIYKQNSAYKQLPITENNIYVACVYFSVTFCIEATWINDRDQFLYPNDRWTEDNEFQNDCFTFALFHRQNKISSKEGTNHWIPFTEKEVNSRARFESNLLNKFITGKLKIEEHADLYNGKTVKTTEKLEFSDEAKSVFDAGRELWRYYHSKPNCNVNASLYDIREYFQGRNEKGKMNNKSEDETYTKLIANLRDSLKLLAQKIEPKVYEYEFLKI
jgi:hypothetical protein